MSAWGWAAAGVGVTALFVGGYFLLRTPPPPPSMGLIGQPNLAGAVDDGARERTAWVNLVAQGIQAGTSIYNNESARSRAASGASVPPSGPSASVGASPSEISDRAMHAFDDWGW